MRLLPSELLRVREASRWSLERDERSCSVLRPVSTWINSSGSKKELVGRRTKGKVRSEHNPLCRRHHLHLHLRLQPCQVDEQLLNYSNRSERIVLIGDMGEAGGEEEVEEAVEEEVGRRARVKEESPVEVVEGAVEADQREEMAKIDLLEEQSWRS